MNKNEIGSCILSGIIGAALGLLEAEIIANSLIEISYTTPFAIIFGIAFMLLGVVLGWRAWATTATRIRRGGLVAFAVLVFCSGLACLLVERNFIDHWSAGAKVPLYSLLGISLSFALTFSFTEFVNLGLCDSCCRTQFVDHPLVESKKQVVFVFGLSLVMGMVYGLLFGALDVEGGDSHTTRQRFNELLIDSIPIGVVFGAFLGVGNQFLRLRGNSDYDEIKPSGYDDTSNL